MNLDLNGKVGLITGSTKGLGFEIAKELALAGAKIGINGRTIEGVNKVLGTNDNFFPARGDLLNYQELSNLSNNLKINNTVLDFLICNVGGGRFQSDKLNTLSRFEYMFNLNLFSAINSIEIFSRNLNSNLSKIIIIGSIASTGHTDAPIEYSLAKGSLENYVKITAKKFAENKVHLNLISPGNLFFQGSVWQKRQIEDPKKTNQYMSDNVPTKTFGSSSDISNVIRFLLSDANNFIVGANIVVDGGQSL